MITGAEEVFVSVRPGSTPLASGNPSTVPSNLSLDSGDGLDGRRSARPGPGRVPPGARLGGEGLAFDI